MIDFSKLYDHAYKSSTTGGLSCLPYPSEHGSLGINRAGGWTWVRSPRWKGLGTLHSTFSGKYGGIDLGCHHHNLVRALTLYIPVHAMVAFKCHDALPKSADQVNLKCMYDILTPPCTYGIPLTGMFATTRDFS